MQPAKLASLVARSGKPIYSSPDDLALAARGLVCLSSFFSSPSDAGRLLAPVRRYARRDPGLLTPVLTDREVFDPSDAAGGRRLAFVLRALPTAQGPGSTAAFGLCAALLTSAMGDERAAWSLADFAAAVLAIRRYGGYSEAFAASVEGVVRRRLQSASAADAVDLLVLVTVLPEVYMREKVLVEQVAARVALLADDLSPSMVGTVCGCLNRIQFRSPTVALALQEEADRVAQGCDARTSVEFLLFICRQEAKYISPDSVQWLLERLIGETLDTTAVLHLCRAIRSLPLALKEQLRQDLSDVVGFVGTQMTELLKRPAAEGGLMGSSLSHDSVQVLLSSFLGLHKVIVPAPADVAALEGYAAAVDACADLVQLDLDHVVSECDSVPIALVGALLEAPSTKARDCGVHLLREMSRECVHLPALQTFRFILLLGDAGAADASVLRYLRASLCKTAADIPPAQLCTALRCFVACGLRAPPAKSPDKVQEEAKHSGDAGNSIPSPRACLSDEVAAELEREESRAFFRFTTEVVRKWFAEGLSMRFALALTDALYTLGYRDEDFYSDMATYLDSRRPTAAARVHASEAAAVVCLALGEDVLDTYPELHAFLLDVQANGTRGEALLRPSEWMALYDPANAIVPLTEQQQEGWNILEKMVATRADDCGALAALGQAYVQLLPFTRPDDLKYFFGVCEDKVLKEDKLLKDCLEQLGSTGITPQLSASTIGAILHSLASLRFAYPRCTRRFIEGVSDEQWREMDIAPLVQILSAMARLSLRMPRQLGIVGERLAENARFLSPQDVADAIRSFQSLGYHDEGVMQALVARAAAAAPRFNEASITTLFSAPAVHRLLRTPDVALPLLQRACGVVTSPHMRRKIAVKVRHLGVSRDLLESCAAELNVLAGAGAANETLRLT